MAVTTYGAWGVTNEVTVRGYVERTVPFAFLAVAIAVTLIAFGIQSSR